jgi:small subunit ribosomal protein S3
MGRKVHPFGFRIGTVRDWQAKWYADKHYPEFLFEDVKLRKAIGLKYADAGISGVEIERQANKVAMTVHTSRPGIVIGRGGQRVDETRRYLEQLVDKRIQLNIQEVRQPELDAYLVARSVADQIEHRVAYRRAMKQAIFRTMQAGAKGMRINCAGRLGGVEIARRQMMHQGRVPLHTLRADIDYGFSEAHTTLGRIGVKVWIYRGDIFPEVEEVEEAAPIGVAAEPTAAQEVVAEPAKETVEKPAAAAPALKEKKPAKPRSRRAVKAEPAAAEKGEAPTKKAEVAPAKEEKPARPGARRVAKAEPKTDEKPKKKAAKKETPEEPTAALEKTDVTTKKGKIQKKS